jgi:hypothetical protein
VGDTQHNQGACVRRTQRPNGCAVVRWRTSCVDQNALVRACVVTPNVGALRSFPEGLYIGGVAEFQPTFWLVVGMLFHFGCSLGERERGVSGSLFELFAIFL